MKRNTKQCKWMTSTLLKSMNTKNQFYKKRIKTEVHNLAIVVNSRRKEEFKSYYNTLRCSIKEAKRLYYIPTFAIYKNDHYLW